MKDAEHYFKRAKIYWIIAAVFASIAVIGKLLLLVIYILERK